ncbi:aldose 1-epimerase [Hyphomonas johnsonii]|uniref:Aldose 1-epimerase n=1 Tax=Hyphomonas johnsonii MHS-2 TaxID=1280950 RepID=A0A059FRN8_9PROT|nr:aldose 1-epimerase [Hyphomonas johnsonii]KCZ93340.1 aldose 1-epimerase [Hyphomonas johnsonii MHS-2]
MSRRVPDDGIGRRADSVISISSHGYEVRVDPVHGGRIVSATYLGLDVLRPQTGGSNASALESACFPLVPFSNRIRNGTFEYAGQQYHLAENWDGDAHVIHGEGWQRPWNVTATDAAYAGLALHGSAWWPWRYDCYQDIAVGEHGIGLSLRLRNTDTVPVPAGLGFHPYFPRTPRTRLQFDARAAWPPMGSDDEGVLALDPANGFGAMRPVSDVVLDHCYEGWDGTARIIQPDSGLEVTVAALTGASHCVVYTPADAPYFCFEPVSHRTGAFEAASPEDAGLRQLEPGETLELAIVIAAQVSN